MSTAIVLFVEEKVDPLQTHDRILKLSQCEIKVHFFAAARKVMGKLAGKFSRKNLRRFQGH